MYNADNIFGPSGLAPPPFAVASCQCQTQTHTQNCQRTHLLIGVIFVLSVGTSCGFSIDFGSNETAVIDSISES